VVVCCDVEKKRKEDQFFLVIENEFF